MTKHNCTCDCKELIIEMLKSNAEQSKLLSAQNAVMAKIVDQNSELMSYINSETDAEETQNLKTLD